MIEKWKKEARELLLLVNKEWWMVRSDTVMAGEGIGAHDITLFVAMRPSQMKSSRGENAEGCGVVSSMPASRWEGNLPLEDSCG